MSLTHPDLTLRKAGRRFAFISFDDINPEAGLPGDLPLNE
ncbi:hypothetical protein OpiT1DRAFT_05209 [Opitutaceae bacterium TAV1]|nr:hypothetical protein OpiT1DRAFT_05209 [Opitutaceae bacterium TAV1]